ncbi:CRISPR-associated endonuclease Cas2 [Saccharopolyspora sp. TS4A08]|uniref:CRISPR-associated endoribonuclease Cas2 n=1 Tax=Saccharopolyspora ipomoeae TaxID=3042027 RepID=A0ABT6PNB6_9PSEU|nr:CRISPR-associated endonuclease Cas2 [Saccharopolyspora sp. TS4A08]MDI2029507.1 CRISPR-associated endonuclease Cas2 [Saccharopolyspora sp. TS4A08]
MARHRYLVAYDISDPVRLRRVAKTVEDYGERIQYSVFLCDLSRADLAELQWRLNRVIKTSADHVLFVDLGIPSQVTFEFLGHRRPLPPTGARVV